MTYSRGAGEANSPTMWSHPTSLEPIAKVGINLLKLITKGQKSRTSDFTDFQVLLFVNGYLTKEATIIHLWNYDK